MFSYGDVDLYALDNDQITDVATYHIAKSPFGTLGWADRDHLFAGVESDVVMITAHGMTPVGLPEGTTLTAPKPKLDGVVESEGPGTLVVVDGAAWWSRCAWGYPYDGFQCTTVVSAELWPGTERSIDAGLTPVTATWADAAPAGFRIVRDDKAVTCTPPNGAATTLTSDNTSDLVDSVHWVSADPPRLLVSYGQFGFANMLQTRWSLHAGCAPQPIASGATSQLGNHGLWLSTEEGGLGTSLWRRGKKLGDLAGNTVAFR